VNGAPRITTYLPSAIPIPPGPAEIRGANTLIHAMHGQGQRKDVRMGWWWLVVAAVVVVVVVVVAAAGAVAVRVFLYQSMGCEDVS